MVAPASNQLAPGQGPLPLRELNRWDFNMDLSDAEDSSQDGDANSLNESHDAAPPIVEGTTTAAGSPTTPKTLLDLPVEVLRLIIEELSVISDLTCIARTNSVLHSLAIPYMYTRFDIVWPESHVQQDGHRSVDALTFGLSTLALGSSFGYHSRRALQQITPRPDRDAGHVMLRDSNYAKFTRQFAISNGPPELIADYMVGKESCKMLATVAALSLRRMVNLESFTWDMPTGVLSEVFLALASLQDHSPDGSCNLKSVWVRWHENTAVHLPLSGLGSASHPFMPPPSTWTSIGHSVPPGLFNAEEELQALGIETTLLEQQQQHPHPYHNSRVEFPNFSVLPPLRSLTVLDIDEMAYLDEMAVLIAASQPVLRELRIGLSDDAVKWFWFHPWNGPDLTQVDRHAQWPGDGALNGPRLGGVMGILVGHFCDIKQRTPAAAATAPQASAPEPRKLKLDTLELERISLSTRACAKALDWTVLTSITLFQCQYSAPLWRELRTQFAPIASTSSTTAESHNRPSVALYQLSLKKIHTDMPSKALVEFVRDTLEPESLQTFFLQDRRWKRTGALPIGSIFRGVVQRHTSSLKKLLIDSGPCPEKPERWCSWQPTRKMLWYMMSGRMKNLHELCINVSFKDWDTFLRGLPNMTQLRALRIPTIVDAPSTLPWTDRNSLVQQMVNIISIQPQTPLCYVAIADKCFEILEPSEESQNESDANNTPPPLAGEAGNTAPPGPAEGAGNPVANNTGPSADGGGDDDDNDTDNESDGSDDDSDQGPNDGSDDGSDDGANDDISLASLSQGDFPGLPRLCHREILFYETVDIFKARHGKL